MLTFFFVSATILMFTFFFVSATIIVLVAIAYTLIWLSENFAEWFNYSYFDKDKTD